MESKAVRPPRTSTPIPEMEESLPFFDSVSEFFYQSWKSELQSSDESSSSQPKQKPVKKSKPAPVQQPQPMYYYSQTVIVYPMVQPYFMPYCYPTVGYRPDGTYGVISSCVCGWHM